MYGTVKGYFPDIDDNITVLVQIESRAGQRRACAARQRRGRLWRTSRRGGRNAPGHRWEMALSVVANAAAPRVRRSAGAS
jgi:hypothetical protein